MKAARPWAVLLYLGTLRMHYTDSTTQASSDFVCYLSVQNGANACYLSKKTGNTPLHFAAWYGSYESVEFLLETNLVDAHAENNFGCTPFDMAPPGSIRTLLHKHMRRLEACR
eukprot:1145833-Pelagomonas_calceolata.AAC.9